MMLASYALAALLITATRPPAGVDCCDLFDVGCVPHSGVEAPHTVKCIKMINVRTDSARRAEKQ